MLTFLRFPVLLAYSLLESAGRMLVFLPFRAPLPASRSFAGFLLALMFLFAVIAEDDILGAVVGFGTQAVGVLFMGVMSLKKGQADPRHPSALRVWNTVLLGMTAGGGLAAAAATFSPELLSNAPLVGIWLGIAIAIAAQREQRRQVESAGPKS